MRQGPLALRDAGPAQQEPGAEGAILAAARKDQEIHRGIGVFEFMAGEDADDLVAWTDDAFLEEHMRTRDTCSRRRFTAKAVAGDHRAVFKNRRIIDFTHHAIHHVERSQGLDEVHRATDFDG